jgi:hypothetical protein
MKLTYWIAECLDDHKCYNIRAKTKKEVVNILNNGYDMTSFSEPRKVTVEYGDAFDLMRRCLSEGSAYWED